MYIITKLKVDDKIVEILGNYDSTDKALSFIFEEIKKQNKIYINKVDNKQYIEVYDLNEGYFYNSKKLTYIFQIIEIDLYTEL